MNTGVIKSRHFVISQQEFFWALAKVAVFIFSSCLSQFRYICAMRGFEENFSLCRIRKSQYSALNGQALSPSLSLTS
jgi:hypothetical protein